MLDGCKAHGSRIYRRRPPYFLTLVLNVLYGSLLRDSILVLEHKYVVVLTEVTIEIFESSASGLRIEEVNSWDESEVEDGPDDVKLPTQSLDTNGRDFNDCDKLSKLGSGSGM